MRESALQILPTLLNDIIRDLSSEAELAAGTSKAVAQLLSVSHSCKITAVLAHTALTTQVKAFKPWLGPALNAVAHVLRVRFMRWRQPKNVLK
jgi:hypothetical protein